MTATGAVEKGADSTLSKRIEESIFWRVKLRLQFSGWLQFIPNAIAALLCWLVGGAAWLLNAGPSVFFWLPCVLGAALLAILLFDIGTVKWGLHPAEMLPSGLDDLDVFDLMRTRRSCRSFQARHLTSEHRTELLEAVEKHSRPEQRLGDGLIRFEYIAAPLTVWPVMGAREFLVAIAPKAYDRVAVIDVGRCLQKIVLHATRMGLATCWIGPGADQASMVAHLAERLDPDEDHIICVCAVGYRSWFEPLFIRLMEHTQNRRLPLSALFFADPCFQQPLDVKAPLFESFGRCYEVCQWSPSSFNSQTTRCVAVLERTEDRERLVRFDFFASSPSRYYAPVALGIWCANWETGCEALGKEGRFSMLSPQARPLPDVPERPHYDVSWVVARSQDG